MVTRSDVTTTARSTNALRLTTSDSDTALTAALALVMSRNREDLGLVRTEERQKGRTRRSDQDKLC